MKKITIALLIVLITGLLTELSAQSRKEIRIQNRDKRRAKKDSLQALPIGSYFSLDFISSVVPNPLPRFNVGYITPIDERWSVGGNVGLGFQGYPYTGGKEDYMLYEIRPQLLYNIKTKRRFQRFFSLETFYIYNNETLLDRSFIPVNNQNGAIERIRYDRADYARVKYGATLNYGEYINFSNRIALRTTIGAGIRFKDNSFTNVVNPRIQGNDDVFLFRLPDTREGFLIGFEFNLSFHFIYKL